MVKLQYLYSVSLIYLWSLVAKNLVFLFKLHYKTSHSACNDLFFSSLALQKMSATLTIPEKSSQEIKLVCKFLQSKVETTTGKDLLLEVQQTMSLKGKKTNNNNQVSGEKIDTPNAIVKYLVAQANKPELLGNNNEEQAQVLLLSMTHQRKITNFEPGG